MRREQQEMRDEMNRVVDRVYQQGQVLNRSIHRIALQPVSRPRNPASAVTAPREGAAVQRNLATLSPRPRSLFDLWHEFEFGIGGRKAAKLFTAAERGCNKYQYHRRKVVWDKLAEMVRAGWSAQSAIDRIHEVYGASSVTHIINYMRRDRRTGGHPGLIIEF